MKKIFRDPLMHFLLIGGCIFLVYNLANKNQGEKDIIIDDYIVAELATKWSMQWKREPDLDELKSLIVLYINQEVLYREALAMNLDHNDEIIKRRLAKKMEFISDEFAETLQPSEAMLHEYYQRNIQRYVKPSKISFKQIYVSHERRKSAIDDAKILLSGDLTEMVGDKISLPREYTNTDGFKVSLDFGSKFAAALDTLSIGKWTGPVMSGFGVHLVFIDSRKPAGFFDLSEVSEKVVVDYNYDASNDFKKELIASFLKNYAIELNLSNTMLKQELSETL